MLYTTPMLTVPEAAARTGKSPETIRRWIRSGRLKARKMGTQHVIEPESLEAIIGVDTMEVPKAWSRTITGEPMPDVVEAVRRSRRGH